MSRDAGTPPGAVVLLQQHLIWLAERAGAADAAGPGPMPAGAVFVDVQRAELETAFQRFERVGQARLSHVCREVVSSPACSFEPRAQWGVCVMTGRTVRVMVRVRVSAEHEFDVDGKFGPFLLGLWHFAHMQTIEETRLEKHASELGEAWDRTRAEAFYTDAEEDGGGLALAYATSLRVVRQVIATTQQTLDASRGAPAATG